MNEQASTSNYRPMSDWEWERWQEIIHACTSRQGGVEFGPQAKAVILAVARTLEEAERQLVACQKELGGVMQELCVGRAMTTPPPITEVSEQPSPTTWVRFLGYNPTRWHRLIDHYGIALTYCGRHWRGNGETCQSVTMPNPPCRTCMRAVNSVAD